jgi:YVTN family beta-propeller protein
MVVDTISTTSGIVTAGNDASTLNQLGPNFLTYDPSDGKIFVSYDPYPDAALGQGDAGGVAVIDSSTGNVTGNIVYGIQPDDVLYDPDNGYVYAVDWRSSEVLVIDPTTDTVLATIDTGESSDPVSIALDPVNDHLFVTVSASDVGVDVIDGRDNVIIDQLAAGLAPWWDVYDPANGELYVENAAGNNVSVLNASTGATVTSIQVSTNGVTGWEGPIGYAPSDGDLFVPVLDAEAAIVSGATNTVIGTIPPPSPSSSYWGFAFDPYDDGGVMLATEWGGSNLTVINATVHPTVATTVPAGGSAAGIMVAGSPAEVYVAAGAYGQPGTDRITRFNASTLVPSHPIQLGTTPGAEVYDPNTGCMAVALEDTGQVLQVSVATGEVERAVSVGAAPSSLAFDPVDGDLYVANFESDNVSILNATGVVGTVPVGVSPIAVVADPGSGDVYVVNYGNLDDVNSTISVLSGDSEVRSFPVEPDSGPDALAFDAATSRLFVVNEYLDNVSEYNPTNGSLIGSFSVGADPVGITLDPDNQELYVLDRLDDAVDVSSAAMLQVVTNVSVGDNPEAISYDPANGLVYVANSGDNDLSAIDPSTDTVLGTLAVGLAPGGPWPSSGGLAPDGPLGSLYVSNWLSGSLSVVATGSATAAVQFGETGLKVGGLWTVTFNGSVDRTTAAVLTFYAANGTYAYAVTGPVGYAPHPASGTVRVAGRSLILPVQFYSNSTPVYAVSFVANGLPESTPWGVTIGSVHGTSTSTNITLYEPNGSYRYSLDATPGYSGAGPAGIEVSGANLAVEIQFGPFSYPVAFNEIGLPPGTAWGVLLGASQVRTVNGQLIANVPNGSYRVTVESPAGYTGHASESSIQVNGAGSNVTVQFVATPPTPPLLSSTTAFYLGATVAVAVVTAAGLVWAVRRRRRRSSDGGEITPPPDEPGT